MEIGRRIKELRQQQGMTLEELGNKVGVGKSTIRKWEEGIIANMKRDKISKLADALGCSPSYLMGWDDEEIESMVKKLDVLTQYEIDIQNILFDIRNLNPTLEEMEQIKKYAEFIISQRK